MSDLNKYVLTNKRLLAVSNWKSFQNPLESIRGLNSLSPTITTRVAESLNASTDLLSTKVKYTTNLRDAIKSGEDLSDLNIRELTPRECGRLMGVSEPDIDKMFNSINNDNDLYIQFGNSIVVDVLYYALKPLFKN
jgi:site-specific DNA-cytosine methylase